MTEKEAGMGESNSEPKNYVRISIFYTTGCDDVLSMIKVETNKNLTI